MMQRRILLLVIVATITAMAVGCHSGQEVATTEEAVSLPPTRTPPASPTAEPSPTPSPTPSSTSPPPTATPSPEPSRTAEATALPIGQLHAGMVGQEVTVEGAVVDAVSFSAGFKFTLDDGSGQVVLLMWHDVYDDCWDAPGINRGAWVRATGEVGEYEGVLQVEPHWGSAVKALQPAGPWAEPRQLGTLSGGDEGRRAMIEGEVVRTGGQENWVEVAVSDGTGEIVVFIWRNILERIPQSVGLGTPGSRVRIVGTVQVYQSNLELVPSLPCDVVVLDIPQEE